MKIQSHEPLSHRFAVRLTESQFEAVTRVAAEQEATPTDLVRTVLLHVIADHDGAA